MSSARSILAWSLPSKTKCLYLAIVSSITLVWLVAGSETGNEGWLKMCHGENGNPQIVTASNAVNCPKGVWQPGPVPSSGCFCLNGLWAVGSNWTDEDYWVLFGQGHCFQLTEETIDRLVFLGEPSDPFSPLNHLLRKTFDQPSTRQEPAFLPFKNQVFLPKRSHLNKPWDEESDYHTILRLEPPPGHNFMVTRSMNKGKKYDGCIELQDDNYKSGRKVGDKSLFVHKLSENNLYSFKEMAEDCPDNVETTVLDQYNEIETYEIMVGEGLHVKSGSIIQSSKECPTVCPIASLSSAEKSNEIGLETDSFQNLRVKRAARSKKHKKSKVVIKPKNQLVTLANNPMKQKQASEQTIRVFKAEVKWIFNRVIPRRHKSVNWRLLQKAKEIFAKLCPKDEIPKFLLNAMLRLFRIMFINTKDFNPSVNTFDDTKQNERIISALNKCMNEGEELVFDRVMDLQKGTCFDKPTWKMMTVPDPDDANFTIQEMQNITVPTCKCNNVISGVSLNYTKDSGIGNEMFNLSSTDFALPEQFGYEIVTPQQTANYTKRDLPIETGWKIINFAHYYCARYFENNPLDHGALLVKMESFFNPDIIYRWEMPGPSAEQIWQNLYSANDLNLFTETIDACVGAAKNVSEYPEWIIRPTLDTLSRKRRSLINPSPVILPTVAEEVQCIR